jgi:hypothetical protein
MKRTCPSCGVFFDDEYMIPKHPMPMCNECLGRQASRHAWATMTRLDRDGRCGKCGADIIGSVAEHELICRFEMTEAEIQIAKKQEHLHG